MWTTTKASSEANIKSCRMRSFMFAVHITKHTHTRCGWVSFFCCVSCFTLCVLLCVCVLLFVLYRSYSHFVYRCDFFPLFFSYCFCLFPHSSNAFGSRIKSATFAQIHIYIYSFWYSIFPPLMCLNIQCLAFFSPVTAATAVIVVVVARSVLYWTHIQRTWTWTWTYTYTNKYDAVKLQKRLLLAFNWSR